jgi:pimeloyl-ACP methyl ester carboxylesterase
VLSRLGLSNFRADPVGTLAALHEATLEEMNEDRLFALAEYSFLHAQHRRSRAYFIAASVYAFAFLYPEDGSEPPNAFDPRLRTAVDLYNRSIARALVANSEELLPEGVFPFHLGTLELSVDESGLEWGDRRLDHFVPAAELEVRGLRNRFRRAGIGAPFVAEAVSVPGRTLDAKSARVIEGVKVPVTFVIRYEDARAGLRSGKLRGTLGVYTERAATEIEIAGQVVPLEYETSSALAYGLENSQIWSREITGFRRGGTLPIDDGLLMLQPHLRGRVPVVLVHGTASSPARWAEMLNDLQSDPLVADHYESWFFVYNTGNPILYSAALLRSSLRRAVAELDPDGRDSTLRRMVLVGHSQGGLMVKLQVVSSGSRFWDNASDRPFDEVTLEPETRELIGEALFFEPLPFVRDVIFIATPHGGSFRAGNWLGRFASSLFEAPQNLLDVSVDLARAGLEASADAVGSAIDALRDDEDAMLRRKIARVPSSIDDMRYDSLFIQTLRSLPIDPDVRAHSIIPVLGGPPAAGQNDGTVAFEAARIDPADSEFVVFHSAHSTQSDPLTIQEVRRILLDALER